MKYIYIPLFILSLFLIFYSCHDEPKIKETLEPGTKIVTIYSGERVVCENCRKTIKEDIDTLNVQKKEAVHYRISEVLKICKSCGEQIPTKREIEISNDFNTEDIKRINSVSAEKFTIEYDDRTAATLDKKIMSRWKISKKELTRIIMKVNMWAVENHFLVESIVTESGFKEAVTQREKIIDE